jgi:hypothetical protein
MTCFELGEGHRTPTGLEVKIEFGCGGGLTIAQAGKLFGIAKEKLNGMITTDKFCCTRWEQLHLSW